MNKDLTTYAKVYHNFISKDLCEATLEEMKLSSTNDWHRHTFYNPLTGTHNNISGDRELDFAEFDFKTKDTLMKLVWEGFVKYLTELDFQIPSPKPKFSHSATFQVIGPDKKIRKVVGSYHPSQQNTFTGKLTEKMLNEVIKQAM